MALAATEALLNIQVMARREGESLATRRDLARQTLNELDAGPQGRDTDMIRILALWLLSLVEQDACAFGEARRWLAEARETAVRAGLDETGFVDGHLAQLDVIEGHVDEGLSRLRAIGEQLRADGKEDAGVGCYKNAALLGMRTMDYRAVATDLEAGLRYAESVEQSYCGHWLQSMEALVSWAAGRWDDAARQGGQALSDAGSGGSHAAARWALGYVDACRGRRADAEQQLFAALDFARGADRLDLMLPAQWGLAEAALQAGDAETAAALSDEALRVAREGGEWTVIAPFAVIGVRSHQAAGRPEAAARYLEQFLRAIGPGDGIARPAILHATGLVRLAEGSTTAARVALQSAIDAWDERGRIWEGLWAKLDLAGTLLRSNRYADAVALIRDVERVATDLGSEPLLKRAAELSRVARGRGEELEAWHPLTTREIEVAPNIAEGLTNAELADELGISPRTASAHVEHILAKLGVSRRAEIAAWAIGVTARTGGSVAAMAAAR
jgi:DNA-binding CsgD family transcriptional regulator